MHQKTTERTRKALTANLPDFALEAVADLQPLSTRDEGAKFLRICQRKFDAEAAAGNIQVVRQGRRVLVTRIALATYLANQTVGAA